MRFLIILLAVLYGVNCAPAVIPVKLSPEFFHPIYSLYHTQNNGGQYVYGYATPAISQAETKTSDGVTHGGYSYIDGSGHLQTVQYTADAVHGFRVAASNLPTDNADVAHARASHLAEFEAIKSEREQIAKAAAAATTVPYFNPVAVPYSQVPQALSEQGPEPVTDLPEVVKARAEHLAALQAAYRSAQAAQLGYGVPQPVQDLPEVVKARAEHLAAVEKEKARQLELRAEVPLSPIPEKLNGYVVPVQTHVDGTQPLPVAPAAQLAYAPEQYTFGPYSYGYVEPFAKKSETRSADGVVQGGYSYIDAFGIVQTVNYIADKSGFRVAGSNIPVDRNHLSAAGTVATGGASPVPVVEQKIVVPASYSTDIHY
ncbi:uncharacterized protein LOC143199668 [Rhynchophorus ferrugineus]|uniref:Cuticle protein 6 n=1 Tax=Rhynchophorus ferrugineus TaxID=354439 RepID=A0A834HZD6_RHYFE|nr:hypothetical protein GWI33_017120 [Rhynchophorus ferrugineus]